MNLHVYPDENILKKYNFNIISKPRCCVIYATNMENINFSNTLFTDSLHVLPYINDRDSKFSFSHMKELCLQKYPDVSSNPYILLECGPSLFNNMLHSEELPDFLAFTIQESDETTCYLAGEIDMSGILRKYQVAFMSSTIQNNDSAWCIKIFKKNIKE